MARVDEDEDRIREQIAKTTAGQVRLGDGVAADGDYYSLVMQACVLAQVFGMGQCKTISEFIDMVNEEDPLTVQTCLLAIGNIQRRMFGDAEDNKPRPPNERGGNTAPDKFNNNNQRSAKHVEPGTDYPLASFVEQHGKSHAEVQEYVRKVKAGEIKLPEADFSFVTKAKLEDPNFDFKGTLAKMNEYVKHTKNYKLRMQDFIAPPPKKA